MEKLAVNQLTDPATEKDIEPAAEKHSENGTRKQSDPAKPPSNEPSSLPYHKYKELPSSSTSKEVAKKSAELPLITSAEMKSSTGNLLS